MYLELFKLKELPFRLSPDPQFLYLSKQHARAKAYMESTIWFTDGFVVITGEIGSGKTTLIESFLKEIQTDVVVAQINQTQVIAVDFLQAVLVQFGFSPFKMKKAELIATLNTFLIEQYGAGRKVLLIVDEAQNLSLRVLEEIRLLSGVETTKEKVLRIILARPARAQREARCAGARAARAAHPAAVPSHARCPQPEMRAYIQHRLEVAGAATARSSPKTPSPRSSATRGGVPRLINTLCDTAMMAAFAANRDHVTLEDLATPSRSCSGWNSPCAHSSCGRAMHAVRQASARPQHQRSRRGVMAVTRSNGRRRGRAAIGRMLVATEGRTIQELPLRVGRIIVGRTPDNDLQIDSRFVSRHHCQIITTPHSASSKI